MKRIRVKYKLKENHPQFPYTLSFNARQIQLVDQLRSNLKENLHLEVSKNVIFRAAVETFASELLSVLDDRHSAKLVSSRIINQLKAAASDTGQ